LATPPAAIPLDLETLTAALGPLTMTEKQAAWFETMGYSPAQAGAMLRVSPETGEKVRHRAAELIRGKVDSWRGTLLAENGPALGREAAAATGQDCLPTKAFLDVVPWLRGTQPLSESESEPFRALLGVAAPRRTGWKRFAGG